MLYGRDAERARIGELLDAARDSRSGALVVRGEPGIGKTALLDDAQERAADMHVLSARGVESEAELPFAALHQLLRPALSYVERLPAPQSAALRGALGLDEGRTSERFLVFTACLSLLSELAERRPVLCLVDDAHWLDAASADALRFVARRLDAEGIVILFSAREGEIRAFEAADVPSLVLEGLNAEAAETLLARGAGLEAARAVRDRLVEQTRGNALALLEVPRELTAGQLAGDEPLPETLPMTKHVEGVFLDRVRRLPESTQRFLVVAAADESEDAALVARAVEDVGVDGQALDAAEAAGLVVVHGKRLEFRHPLVRSAVYESAPFSERRAAHRALARALAQDGEQADRRAWHLAASALEADEAVVCALEEAARRAEDRAGYMAAARALERAAELSADPDSRARNLVGAARNLSLAGQDGRAVAVADQAEPLVVRPEHRAELAHVRGLAAVRSGGPAGVVGVLVEAAAEVAPIDPARAIDLLMDATSAAWQGADVEAYLDIARLAESIVPPDEDEASNVLVGSIVGFAAMIRGDTSEGVRLIGQLTSWGATAEEPRHATWASFGALWLGDEAGFDALNGRATSMARARGELGNLCDALGIRAGQLAFEQRYEEASVAASEAVQLARELNAANLELLPLAALAIVFAIRGRDDEARRHGEDVLDRATRNGLPLRASAAVYALAVLDLGRARWADALRRLDSLWEGGAGALDPIVAPSIPDKIEAAVRAARRDEAEAALPPYEAWVGYTGAPAAQRRLASCRALLAEGAEATDHFETALAIGGTARPFDLARIHLLHGEHLRRERRRTDARVQLRAALEAFERFRAEPWAERARAELRASGETARKRDPSTAADLTPQELQIARFVAEGLSNKEVAAQLFLSPRTIDAHLRNVFGKLGIKSRTQLARLPLGEGEAGAAVGAMPTPG